MNVHSLRAFAALGISVSMIVAACQAGTGMPSPSASATPGASTAEPSPAPLPTEAAPTASTVASPTTGGRWIPVAAPTDCSGSLVALLDGGALCIDGDSSVERWDPAAAAWRGEAPFNAPRWDFAAVRLHDGHVFVIGGVNEVGQAYSSAYTFDPRAPGGTWTKVGLMGTARMAPAAAVLHDGRVLVAGGAYVDVPAGHGDGVLGAVLAASHPGSSDSGGGHRLDDVAPSHVVPALATAEVYDPAGGTWSPTGSMRYARVGATAVTLADGRVLVVARGANEYSGIGVTMDPRASTTAEIYDPATRRFTLVDSLPPIDWAAISETGVEIQEGDPWWASAGTLVALPDGDALLIAHSAGWGHESAVTRSFRFIARSGSWRKIGSATAGATDTRTDGWSQTRGVHLASACVAGLPNGRVLVAGGEEFDPVEGVRAASRAARLYDAATDAWLDLPPMPEGRTCAWAGHGRGGTVALEDGTALLVGGTGSWDAETAVQFVP